MKVKGLIISGKTKTGILSDLSFTAKSIVFDNHANWGGLYTGMRAVEFYYKGSMLELPSFSSYSNSEYDSRHRAVNAFNTSTLKSGRWADSAWLSKTSVRNSTRFGISLSSPIIFDSIMINNSHAHGGDTNTGVRNVTITMTMDNTSSTTYQQPISNGVVIFDGELPQHGPINGADDYVVPLI